jgi:hypothetical protein
MTQSVWRLDYGLDDGRIRVRVPVEARVFHFSAEPTPALGHGTQIHTS